MTAVPAAYGPAAPRAQRRAWLVWAVAVSAYVVAVWQRSSLAGAGLDATRRFHASASGLSSFAVLQLLVYAVLQVPAGALLDRFGARRLVVTGAVVMALGQAVLSVSTTLTWAVVARAVLGAGDALTFISVLRLVSAWFPTRLVPVVTQMTGLLGQIGQLVSVLPFAALLHTAGWTPAFAGLAAVGLLVGLLVLVAVRDAPPGSADGATSTPGDGAAGSLPVADGPVTGSMLLALRAAWLHPGTRLGLWTHFTTQFSGTVFGLLWGFPFLVSGEGLAPGTARRVLSVTVVVGMLAGPVMGHLVGRHPLRRSWLVLGLLAAAVAGWSAVLLWGGRAPLWLLVLLAVGLGLGGPASMVGFDYARTFNPPDRLGSATGIVNVGGFAASLVTILLIGIVLDAAHGAGIGEPEAFRWAMAVQYLVWCVGVGGILRTRVLVRRQMAAAGVVVPPIRQALRREWRRRRARSGRA